jgi:hypothetical protein
VSIMTRKRGWVSGRFRVVALRRNLAIKPGTSSGLSDSVRSSRVSFEGTGLMCVRHAQLRGRGFVAIRGQYLPFQASDLSVHSVRPSRILV